MTVCEVLLLMVARALVKENWKKPNATKVASCRDNLCIIRLVEQAKKERLGSAVPAKKFQVPQIP